MPDPSAPFPMPGPEALAALLDAQAAVLGLPIAAAHRPGVLHYLGLSAQMAASVFAVPLAPQAESGSVFRPVEPEGGA